MSVSEAAMRGGLTDYLFTCNLCGRERHHVSKGKWETVIRSMRDKGWRRKHLGRYGAGQSVDYCPKCVRELDGEKNDETGKIAMAAAQQGEAPL